MGRILKPDLVMTPIDENIRLGSTLAVFASAIGVKQSGSGGNRDIGSLFTTLYLRLNGTCGLAKTKFGADDGRKDMQYTMTESGVVQPEVAEVREVRWGGDSLPVIITVMTGSRFCSPDGHLP